MMRQAPLSMPFSRSVTFFCLNRRQTKQSNFPYGLVRPYILIRIQFLQNYNYHPLLHSPTGDSQRVRQFLCNWVGGWRGDKKVQQNDCDYIQLVVKMRQGVLTLNIFISVFYIIVAGLVACVLKKSSRSLKRAMIGSEIEGGWRERVSSSRVVAMSWAKKYTLIGGCLNEDKKYLLKEFVFVGAYAATCLQINRIILWPVTFSLFLLPLTFIAFDVVLKKCNFPKVSQAEKEALPKQTVNAIRNQGQSEIQIDTVNIDAIPAISAQPLGPTEEVKEGGTVSRSKSELVLNSALCLSSILMLFQTVMTLTNSISNSGQLNIASVLIIASIDQFAIRPAVGLLIFAIIKLAEKISSAPIIENFLVSALCQEELREVIALYLQEKKRRQQEMVASPPRKKLQSPSRVPKAALPGGEHTTYLNLINLQPTRRKTEQQQQNDISAGIQQVYLTTLQQQLFGNEEERPGGGSSTKRKINKENKEHSCLSAVKRFTIEEEEHSEDQQSKQDPLQECHFNRVDPFNYNLSPLNTKRRGPIRKKPKRVLNLTGSSPYLEYLPNMLKNVDKFKTISKETRVL